MSTVRLSGGKSNGFKFAWLEVEEQQVQTTYSTESQLRFYGVDEAGASVALSVTGFHHYFYCTSPNPSPSEVLLGQYRVLLENATFFKGTKQNYLCKILSVKHERLHSVLGYTLSPANGVLKITVYAPPLIPAARRAIDNGALGLGLQTFEGSVPFALRFMVDRGIAGCSWLEVPARDVVPANHAVATLTTCKRELTIPADLLIVHGATAIPEIGKLRLLSFDIECKGRRGIFPDPAMDSVIQIGNYVWVHGEPIENAKRTIFVLGGCHGIQGATVRTFVCEVRMLLAWREFVQATNPDILTGYNIEDFDIPYLLNRARHLQIGDTFGHLGRVRGELSEMTESTFSSAAFGTRTTTSTKITGRVTLDMIQHMRRNHKLDSYTLNAVSAEFLNSQKDDIHHTEISVLQDGSDADRTRLARYCLKDAQLPLLLIIRLHVVINYVEMARVTGVSMDYLLRRGQQIKVLSMMYRKARSRGLVVPDRKYPDRQRGGAAVGAAAGAAAGTVEAERKPDVFEVAMKNAATRKRRMAPVDADDEKINLGALEAVVEEAVEGYQGATVLEPKSGFYTTPIATLDFASLYPSIMRAHNLCYTTLLTSAEAEQLRPEDKELSPCGHWFARSHVKMGMLPEILTELLDARAVAKNDMKNAPTPQLRAVMDGRQSALKVSANSVYGFTGATVGALPCIPISASVTSYGRDMLETTKTQVEEKFTVANGYPADAEVVYGDTDSVMVRFWTSSCAIASTLDKAAAVELALRLGKEAAVLITKSFPPPVSLEFEKVYFPYLLLAKKRYAGVYWTKSTKHDKLDFKGIEIVRRDNCKLVRVVLETCLHKILIDSDLAGAISYAQQQISDLRNNKIDMSLLVISKGLTRSPELYASPQPHGQLALKLAKRDPGSAPAVGDRIPYVIVRGVKNAKVSERSEDPIYAIENNIPLDVDYYIEMQLQGPLMRLFGNIIETPVSVLFHGDHTLARYQPAPATGSALGAFLVKKTRCRGCNGPVASSGVVCEGCEPLMVPLYLRELEKTKANEVMYNKLWTQCQRCQGSLLNEVKCASAECPIFYRRKKAKVDLDEALQILKGFGFD